MAFMVKDVFNLIKQGRYKEIVLVSVEVVELLELAYRNEEYKRNQRKEI